MPIVECRSAPRRRSACRRLAVATLLLALAAAPGRAAREPDPGKVSGTVTDVAGEPLAGVEVTLGAGGEERATATTNRRGRFSLSVAAGDHVLRLAKEGYAPFTSPLRVEAGDRKVVSVQLLDAAAGRRSEAAQAFNAAAAAREAGDLAAAREGFLAAVAADPTLVEAQRALALLHLDEGAWAEAARAAEAYLAARPDDRDVRLMAYEAYRRLGETPRLVELRRALGADAELAPKLALHAFNEGAAAGGGGDVAAAEARFREALALDDGLAAAHFALATLEYRQERYEEALATLADGLAREPDSAQGRRLAFLVRDARGEAEAAAEAMAAYGAVDPAGAVEILFNRAEVDFRAGDSAAARELLGEVIELQPDHAPAHHILGLAYVTSDAEAAKRHLRRFLELAPEDPEAAAVREIISSLE